MVNQIVQQSKDWVLNNKLATFLSVALFAMVITTIALAVSNNNNSSDLDECQATLWELESGTTTVSLTETAPPADTTVTDSTIQDGSSTTTISMDTSPITTTEASTTLETTTAVDPETNINYRLPVDNIPLHYDLLLHPDMDQGSFTGRTTITILTERTTDQIVLHSYLLDIGRITIKCLNDSTFTYINSAYDEKLNFLKINLNKALPERYISELTIEFSGRLDEQIVGFYSSAYKTEDGTER
ncbi:AGAP003077-PA-like protein [Anopheles sinensis]|uniref:AGAP003077-PA-like protein n=1 Tax=Anopheles sinensis TaxID=74873 RepID=A0A084W8Z1_ANOSI|nr:AGAP003077-PA-like protein [Anopheles sinensis]